MSSQQLARIAPSLALRARRALVRMCARRPQYFFSFALPRTELTLDELRSAYAKEREIARRAAQAHAEAQPARVATLLSTNRPHRLRPTLELLASQERVELECIIATHGFTPSTEERNYALELGLQVRWIEAAADLHLGDVYNLILDQVHSPFVAKIDDDDWYGRDYLANSTDVLRRSGADVVGCNAHFVYLEADDAVYLRFPKRYCRTSTRVAGGTIVAHTQVLKDLRFEHTTIGEDADLLNRALLAGKKIYSSTPFGYVLRRNDENTWKVSQSYLLADAELIHTGSPSEFEFVE